MNLCQMHRRSTRFLEFHTHGNMANFEGNRGRDKRAMCSPSSTGRKWTAKNTRLQIQATPHGKGGNILEAEPRDTGDHSWALKPNVALPIRISKSLRSGVFSLHCFLVLVLVFVQIRNPSSWTPMPTAQLDVGSRWTRCLLISYCTLDLSKMTKMMRFKMRCLGSELVL